MRRASLNETLQPGSLFSGEIADQLDGLNQSLALAPVPS